MNVLNRNLLTSDINPMRTFHHPFSTILGLPLLALSLSGCGVIHAELETLAQKIAHSPTPAPSSFQSYALTDGTLLGKNKYVGFRTDIPGGTTLDSSGNSVFIEVDGIHVYSTNGTLITFIPLDRNLYPSQIASGSIIAAASDGSFFIGGIPNATAQELLKVSPQGVITPITMNVPCYGFRDIKVMTLNGNDVVHVTIPRYQGGAASGPADPSLIHVYDLDGNHLFDYGSEATKPDFLAQAPSGDLYTIAEGSGEIFHYEQDGDYIDSYAFAPGEVFNQISFASNGDMLLLRVSLSSDAGIYRYSMPAMTLLNSITTASDPLLNYPVDMIVTSTGFDINVGLTPDTRRRVRYLYSAGSYSVQSELTSAGTGTTEFKIESYGSSYNFSVTDTSENIYILDEGNKRILSMSETGAPRFTTSVAHADISDFGTSAITLTSTNQVVVMALKDLTNGHMFFQKFSSTTGASLGTVDFAWPYGLQEFVGIDTQDRVWFYVGYLPSGLGLVAYDLAGNLQEDINVGDSTTYFGKANLTSFRIAGDHIFAMDYMTYKTWVSDFSGNAELLFADEEYTTADILAGLPLSLKRAQDGTYYMSAIDSDFATLSYIVFDLENKKITKKLSSARFSSYYTAVLTSSGLWQGLADNLMMLLEF